MREKQIAFIKREIGVDVSCLGIAEIERLARYALNCIALETPRAAESIAREIGLKVTLR
jgi:hypothetical protein